MRETDFMIMLGAVLVAVAAVVGCCVMAAYDPSNDGAPVAIAGFDAVVVLAYMFGRVAT